MFYASEDSNGKGKDAEAIVWEKLKGYFLTESTFGIQHYPIFNTNWRQEIDILLVDKEYGVSVIEIKGLHINQIDSIRGHSFICNNFYVDSCSPYRQAELQAYNIYEKINDNPILFNTFQLRAILALPYITSGEWRDKGFHNLPNNPPILFKDDLESKEKTLKLFKFTLKNRNVKQNQLEWSFMKQFFSIEDKTETRETIKDLLNPETNNRLRKKYSTLIFFKNLDDVRTFDKNLHEISSKTINIIIFSYVQFDKSILVKVNNNLDLYYSMNKPKISEFILDDYDFIADTNNIRERIKSDFSEFNIEQYSVIHYKGVKHLSVQAGAGSGKTTMLINRVLFTLVTMDMQIKDIIIMTFTNKASEEIKSRLFSSVYMLYEKFGESELLELADQIKSIQISTIHSYSNSIIRQVGYPLGFNKRTKIVSNITKRKEVIAQNLEKYLSVSVIDKLISLNIHIYELINFAFDIWENCNQQNLTASEIDKLDWGGITKENEFINEILKKVIFESECELLKYQIENDIISPRDMIKYLKYIQENNLLEILPKNMFLYVDEFQDSDIAQIELVSTLCKNLKYKILVVGDVNQAIYRFRGADYKAFEVLEQLCPNEEFHKESLRLNYRSNYNLIDFYHNIFIRWNKLELYSYDNLYKQESLIKPHYPNSVEVKKLSIENNVIDDVYFDFRNTISTLMSEMKHNEKIGIIVRTNEEVRMVENLCVRLDLVEATRGSQYFYKSDTVQDFYYILKALIYPKKASCVYNALSTPYFGLKFNPLDFIIFDGDNNRILEEVDHLDNTNFKSFVEKIKVYGINAIINTLAYENSIESRVYSHYLDLHDKYALDMTKQYMINLYHLLDTINEKFGVNSATAYTILEWLEVQMKTNIDERLPNVEIDSKIEIITAHKAKGLEYYAVLLPLINNQKRNSKLIYVENNSISEQKKIGWKYEYKSRIANTNYYILDKYEKKEMSKEETRLLGVALTRAKQKIVIFKSQSKSKWNELLDGLI